ncbi:MAG TPA: OpgC domain-containing protein [Bryobacteraceae bacterium]|nr:OpgC domain-containing protein [Bryobacteraceae bacterium]
MSSAAPALERIEIPEPRWKRDATIDFFRGLGLWMIFLDHLDHNVWSNITLSRFGFSDWAEVFVFLSGFMSVGSWEKVFAQASGAANPGCSRLSAGVFQKLSRRVARLYIAQISALLLSLALLWACAQRGVRVPDPAFYMWINYPAQGLLRVLLLLYTPGIFTLLLLYLMVAPLLPLMVFGLKRAPKLTLSISAATWLLVQLPVFHSVGLNWRWYFNPLAWQFLFALGAAARYYSNRLQSVARSRPVIVMAVGFLAASAALKFLTHFDWTVRHAGKPDLAWYRLVHFLALVILVTVRLPRHRRWLQSPVARWAVICGEQSLLIFAASLVLDVAGNLLLAAAPQGGPLLQLAISLSGILLLCWIAHQSRKSME